MELIVVLDRVALLVGLCSAEIPGNSTYPQRKRILSEHISVKPTQSTTKEL